MPHSKGYFHARCRRPRAACAAVEDAHKKGFFSDNTFRIYFFIFFLDFSPSIFIALSVHMRIQIRFRDFDLCA